MAVIREELRKKQKDFVFETDERDLRIICSHDRDETLNYVKREHTDQSILIRSVSEQIHI